MVGLDVAGEVVTAATALAGLVLVYLGSLSASLDSFSATERKSVVARHKWRANAAFAGMIFALTSAALGVCAKWVPSEGLADCAVLLLAIAFGFGAWAAFMSVRDLN